MNASRAATAFGGRPQLVAPIKLVIWDLDETFWSGTLSEGVIEERLANRKLIRDLNRRGIVNAICSKNDFDDARSRLEADGDWDEFVFPSIDWTPKGPRIASLIESMGLRPVNVLFVDDNHLNLSEAQHYAPGIQTIDPQDIQAVTGQSQLEGKDDSSLTRLKQYRILETKVSDKLEMGASNEEFLRASEIRVGMHSDCLENTDRLLELVNRSNQLNYTKARFERAEFEALLSDASVVSGYVTVRDKYGDHGICGFYAYNEVRIISLAFSCRILNMGVELWVYRNLGAPAVSVVGEVASPLESPVVVDWISHEEVRTGSIGAKGDTPNEPKLQARVLLKGGCDLSVVADHVGGNIVTEFTFPSVTGASVHQEHTEILRRATPETVNRYGDVIDRLPFLERAAYRSAILESPESFDVIVYSVLMDYTQGLYRYRNTDFVVPFGEFSIDVTASENQLSYIERLGSTGFDEEFFAWFSQNFTFEGPLTVEMLNGNLRWLRAAIPPTVRLVLLNGAEVPSANSREPQRDIWHAEHNRMLDSVVEELPNTRICDVRLAVTSGEDLANSIRHYSRRAYINLASVLVDSLSVSGVRRRNRIVMLGRKIGNAIGWRIRRIASHVLANRQNGAKDS